MKLKIFIIVSCLCVHFSASEENVVDVEKSESEHLLELMFNILKAETRLNHTTNEEFTEKYGHRQIEITYVSTDNRRCLVSKEKISIDSSLAEEFLEAFAGSIKTISVNYNLLPGDKHKYIGHLINHHCSETLEEFHAKRCRDGAFDEMEKPFQHVTNVVFDGEWLGHAEHHLGLDQLFPQMRVLNLTYTNGYIFDRYYENLLELNVFGQTAYDLGKLIRKNRQIQVLRVEETTMGFLRYVSEMLDDQLVTLAFNVPLDLPHYQEPAIRFPRVNELSITDFDHFFRPGKFSFENLEHFELLVNGNIRDEWISFIGSNKDLKSLTITQGYLNDATLLSLSKKFAGLQEARINCDSAVSVESVADFMENNKQMKSFTLNLEIGSATFFKDFTKKLDNQWKIKPVDGSFSILIGTKIEPYVEHDVHETYFDAVEKQSNEESTSSDESTDSERDYHWSLTKLLAKVMNKTKRVVTPF